MPMRWSSLSRLALAIGIASTEAGPAAAWPRGQKGRRPSDPPPFNCPVTSHHTMLRASIPRSHFRIREDHVLRDIGDWTRYGHMVIITPQVISIVITTTDLLSTSPCQNLCSFISRRSTCSSYFSEWSRTCTLAFSCEIQ